MRDRGTRLVLALLGGAAIAGCEPLPVTALPDHEGMGLGGLTAGQDGTAAGQPTPAPTASVAIDVAATFVLRERQGDNMSLGFAGLGLGLGSLERTGGGRTAGTLLWAAGSGPTLRQLVWFGVSERDLVAGDRLDLAAGQLEYTEPGLDLALARTWRSKAGTLRLVQAAADGAATRWLVALDQVQFVAQVGTVAAGGFMLEATCSARLTGP